LIIIYTPADGEPERYDARTLRVSEASIVQRTVDLKWAEILQGLNDEDIDAMRGVVWVLKKRSNPSLRFGEFDPGVDEMVTRMDKREISDYIEGAFQVADANPEVSREDIAHALRAMPQAADDPEHAERLIAELAKPPKDQPDQAPEETPDPPADGGSSSPSLTSSLPEGSGSASSDTSATSLPEMSTT
jgi:hypothetical protein